MVNQRCERGRNSKPKGKVDVSPAFSEKQGQSQARRSVPERAAGPRIRTLPSSS